MILRFIPVVVVSALVVNMVRRSDVKVIDPVDKVLRELDHKMYQKIITSKGSTIYTPGLVLQVKGEEINIEPETIDDIVKCRLDKTLNDTVSIVVRLIKDFYNI